jgi:hypothetical protein
MAQDKFIFPCFTCGNQFQFGPHRYDGENIPRYQICGCRTCYAASWDGWGPHHEQRVLAHLEKKGLPIPERNEKGWLPRGK